MKEEIFVGMVMESLSIAISKSLSKLDVINEAFLRLLVNFVLE